jgi:hypothetical protein
MRLIKPTLAFVVLTTLLGCSHQAPLTTASPLLTSRASARTTESTGPERAKEIVTEKFTEQNTQVVSVEVKETVTPMIYDFTCSYRRAEFGKICLYVAHGQVDTDSAKLRSTHRVSACLGAERI